MDLGLRKIEYKRIHIVKELIDNISSTSLNRFLTEQKIANEQRLSFSDHRVLLEQLCQNGLISVEDLREMDKIAASMDEDYTLEDLIQAVECKEEFTRPHSFVVRAKAEKIRSARENEQYLECDHCKHKVDWNKWNSEWNYCPFCGFPIIRWTEED